MKKILALVMALALVLLAAPGLAEMKEFTYCVPRTVENLEDSPFHIAQRLLAEEGYTMNIQETFGTTDTKMVATNQAQFCGPGPWPKACPSRRLSAMTPSTSGALRLPPIRPFSPSRT